MNNIICGITDFLIDIKDYCVYMYKDVMGVKYDDPLANVFVDRCPMSPTASPDLNYAVKEYNDALNQFNASTDNLELRVANMVRAEELVSAAVTYAKKEGK